MPEYLSPNVYVEEVDTGSKPIEGVSTSTAGMLGVTERGPSNVPLLVTSYGEYTRWFGDKLDPSDFATHCFLPHAVEGFFTNGGKRLYVSRVEAPGATRAEFDLHGRGDPATSAETFLLRAATDGDGLGTTKPLSPPLYVLNTKQVFPNSGGLAANAEIRIGSGSETEYGVVSVVPASSPPLHVALNLPLARAHAATTKPQVTNLDTKITLAVANLVNATERGTSIIELSAGVKTGDLLEIDSKAPNLAEYRFVVAAIGTTTTLDSPLSVEHAAGATVSTLDPTQLIGSSDSLDVAAAANGGVAFLLAAKSGTYNSHLIVLDSGTAGGEARRIGTLAALFADGAFDNYPGASIVACVTPTNTGSASKLTAQALAGTTAIAVDNRDSTIFKVGTVVQLGVGALTEYATIANIPNSSTILPNPGILILDHALRNPYATGSSVQALATALSPKCPATALLFDVRRADTTFVVSDGGGSPPTYASLDMIRITTPAGGVYYHTLTGATACDAAPVTLTKALQRPHGAGAEIAGRDPLLTVQAIDTGAWGNRLRVTVEDESPGLVSRTGIVSAIATSRLKLYSLMGVEAGTVLEVFDATTGVQLGDALKVQSVSRSTGEVTLDSPGLSALQFASLASPGAFQVRSREFRMTIRLMRQPDPTLPSRDATVLDREVFRYLSMDSRHSRYVQTIIGVINGTPRLSDHRPDGESWYVRVSDITPAATVRLGPEALVDLLPDGRVVPAQHPLSLGDDSVFALNDSVYIGQDDVNPEKRTGLFSLANVEDISIVACPGRTSVQMQNALITHCEQLQYRFAVLDPQGPPDDAIEDIISQRQQYDTKYAALYHPWLLVPQPFPVSAATPPEFAIPPSGHVLGVFARTDVERGVHKAPANEVLAGILGLQRTLNKEQHDVLNPYPTNINVIRDFRTDSRGIRVYGARCITSDTDWKYVNVRRLLIFIEKSINLGLQWVVFEPNAEHLWARVRRSITNFLTLIWRNEALEGTKVDHAFFVKCDRTTMTQTDIDSGRLICKVGVAPVKPAEFVIVRIGLWTADADN